MSIEITEDGIEKDFKDIYALFPRLEERKTQMAGTLSGGEQQMLAMGRALLSGGEMIVMDEPSMGLSPLLVSEVFQIIQAFREKGKTVLLVEQNAKKAMSVSDRVYVLETGSIKMSGNADELINDPNIKKAYLGE
jgi:branched-chain amino acid transport system ATP-binding protein